MTEDTVYGAWVEGFYGYEKETGIPSIKLTGIPSIGGDLSRTQHYYETFAGFDVTTQIDGETSLKFGPLFGYTHTSQQYSTSITKVTTLILLQ